MPTQIAHPKTDEYPEFFKGYIGLVENEPDIVATLEQQKAVIAALGRMPAERASFRYADGKWSVKEVIGHMTDAERIFSYRLLRIARGDQTLLPSFDENSFAASSHAERRDAADLATEMAIVRESSLALVRSLEDQALGQRGTISAGPITARAQLFVIAGHFAHHVKVLKERYGVALA